jgi:hypothetical protein
VILIEALIQQPLKKKHIKKISIEKEKKNNNSLSVVDPNGLNNFSLIYIKRGKKPKCERGPSSPGAQLACLGLTLFFHLLLFFKINIKRYIVC